MVRVRLARGQSDHFGRLNIQTDKRPFFAWSAAGSSPDDKTAIAGIAPIMTVSHCECEKIYICLRGKRLAGAGAPTTGRILDKLKLE
jgi:hypothetical protein